jgi:uncharacterized protein involved in response to NO
MLFGYLSAIIAAFLLTAVPNWTGRLPVRGLPLFCLVLLWLLARLTLLTSAWLGPWPGVVLDTAFLAVFAAVIAREILIGKNWRNLPVVSLVAVLAVASLLSSLEPVLGLSWDALGDRFAIAAIAGLVALIGGRITPSFTTNWLKARGARALPTPFGELDQAVLVLTGLALVLWLLLPTSILAGLALIAAAAGTVARLSRWRGRRTIPEPLLLILHIGYAWLAVGLLALGLAALEIIPRSGAFHAMTAGVFGTMTLAVMTRATLGHTGRPLLADGWTVVIYLLVNIGALARVLASVVPPAYLPGLHLAGLAWGGAYLLFALRYGPMLLGPRVRRSAPQPAQAR